MPRLRQKHRVSQDSVRHGLSRGKWDSDQEPKDMFLPGQSGRSPLSSQQQGEQTDESMVLASHSLGSARKHAYVGMQKSVALW